MGNKPTYKELEQRIKKLERKLLGQERLEEALRLSEKRFSSFMKHIPGVAFMKDKQGRYLYFNEACEKVVGAKLEDWQGKTDDEVLPADVAKQVKTNDQIVMRSGKALEVIENIPQEDGIHNWLSIKFPLFDENKKPAFLACISVDITEQKKVENTLRESESRYRNLVETSQDLIWRADSKGRFTFLNPAWKKTLGYKEEEMLGKCFTEFKTPEQAGKDLKTFKSTLKGKKLFDYETTYISKSGEPVHLVFKARNLKDVNNNIIGTQGTAYDITERKRTEIELDMHRKYLEKLVKEQTLKLTKTNENLIAEINERKQAAKELKKREAELKIKTTNLEEVNVALKVMLKKKDEVKIDLEETMLSNVKELVVPYLEKLKKSRLDEKQNSYLSVLESNLTNITSSFSHKLTSKYINLTPTEIRVANLIKHGNNTKEIADLLSLSTTTIDTHRRNIRKKIGIKKKKANLRTHLISLG